MHRRFKVPYRWSEEFSTVTNPDAHYFKAVSKKHPFYPIDVNAAVKRIHGKNLQSTSSEVAAGKAENIRE
jgi:hypothetical protein